MGCILSLIQKKAVKEAEFNVEVDVVKDVVKDVFQAKQQSFGQQQLAKKDVHDYLNSPIDVKDTIIFIPPVELCQVISVYDGDTFTVAAKITCYSNQIYRFPVRINHIDCAELRTSNEEEHECAVIAKTVLSDLILGKKVRLMNRGKDKYGRLLADVITEDNINCGDYLIEKKLAVRYEGKTKHVPEHWMEYYKKK